MRVAERLLRHPEQRGLDVPGHAAARQPGVHLDGDREAAAPREALRVPSQRRGQPHLVEQGRVEEVGERADLPLALLDQRQRLLDRVVRVRREVRRHRADPRGGEARADEDLRRAVVQLARDPAPLVVLQRQEPAAEAAERRFGPPAVGHVPRAAQEPDDAPADRVAHRRQAGLPIAPTGRQVEALVVAQRDAGLDAAPASLDQRCRHHGREAFLGFVAHDRKRTEGHSAVRAPDSSPRR